MSTENELADSQLDDVSPIVDDDIEVVVEDIDAEVEVEGAAPDENAEDAAPVEEYAPEPEASAAPAEEVDPELESMPTKFRKRLEREQRLRNTIIGEREQIKQAAVQIAQLAKQRDEEVAALRQQNALLQRQFAESLDYAYERDISLKAAEVRRAREDGNYDAELKAQGDLDALRFQHNQLRQTKASLPTPEAVAAAPRQQQPQARPQPQNQQAAPPPASPLAVKWVDSNKAWLNSPKFAGHRAFTLEEDRRLAAEGYDKNSPEYYAELDRRIDAAFPTLRKKGRTGSPVAPAGSSAAASKSGKTITITRADLANMQRFGLDPNNKEHLREYARSKRANA